MNDAEGVAQVRSILDERWLAEETICQINQLARPPVERKPVELTDRGWPVLRAAPGMAWESHDDPEMP